MSIELLSLLFVAVFVAVLLTGLPLAFATGAVSTTALKVDARGGVESMGGATNAAPAEGLTAM